MSINCLALIFTARLSSEVLNEPAIFSAVLTLSSRTLISYLRRRTAILSLEGSILHTESIADLRASGVNKHLGGFFTTKEYSRGVLTVFLSKPGIWIERPYP
jgi:hypothetical protein